MVGITRSKVSAMAQRDEPDAEHAIFARQFFTNEDLDSGPGKPAENHLLRIRGKEGAGRFEEATQKGMAASSLNGLLRARLLAKDRDWQIVTSPEHRFLIRINLVYFKGLQINQ